MTGLVWSGEWLLARRRRRTFILNIFVPLLLVAPIALSHAPDAHAAAVYAVLFTLFGTFGAAIPLVRDAENGLLQRVALTGFPARRLLLQRILAGAAIDAVQLAPALLVIVAAARPPAITIAGSGAALAAALIAANTLGTWIAAIARSIAEAALFAAVLALFALHAAGVFRTPPPGSLAASLELLSPFRPLHEALLATAAAAPLPQAGASVLAAALGAAAALALTAAVAEPLLRRLALPATN